MTTDRLHTLSGPDRTARLYATGARLAASCDERTVLAALIEANNAFRPPLPLTIVRNIAEDVTGHGTQALTKASPSLIVDLRLTPEWPRSQGALPTQVDIARWLAERNAHEWRFDHSLGRDFVFQNGLWVPVRDGEIVRRAMDAIDGLVARAREFLEDRASAFMYEFRQAATRGGIMAIIALARNLKPVALAGGAWNRHPLLLGTPSGVIDLLTGRLRVGQPDDMITMRTRVGYDVHARSDRWERFVFEVADEDPALAAYLQRAVGYSITGLMVEQALWMLLGAGANGKSTLLETVVEVLGDYACVAPASTFDAEARGHIPNDLAMLVEKRFVVGLSEAASAGGTRLNEARLKQISGGDTVTARHMRQEFFQFVPVAKLWFAFNSKPRLYDNSAGLWRRLHLIELKRKFAIDTRLREELRAEGPGILRWLVEGALLYQEQGLGPPSSVTAATGEYRREADPLTEFLTDCCDVSAGPTVSTRSSVLWLAYTAWCDSQKLLARDRLDLRTFGERLKSTFESRRKSDGVHYFGVELRRGDPVSLLPPDTPV